MTDKEKIKFFDTLAELLQMGFDLDKNSARDLIGCVNYLMDKKPKRGKNVKLAS